MAHYFKSIPCLVPLEQSQEYSQQIANLQEIYVERETEEKKKIKEKKSNKRRETKIINILQIQKERFSCEILHQYPTIS